MTTDLSDEEIETLLANCRRRYALYCLFRFATPMTLPTVADRVTELTYGVPAETLLDERLQMYLTLYHDQMPRLTDAGIVEYHQEDDTVDLAENAPVIKPYVTNRLTQEFDGQWPHTPSESC